jgi:hypothetical protein
MMRRQLGIVNRISIFKLNRGEQLKTASGKDHEANNSSTLVESSARHDEEMNDG